MAKTVSVSSLEYTPDEALELMVHHLKMAGTLFEAVPDGSRSEFIRLMRRGYIGPDEPLVAFYDLSNAYYEKLKAL